MTRVLSYGHIPDELVLLIFRLRDKNDSSFNHALVCKQWHQMACLTQTAVSNHSGRRITIAELLRSVSKFTNLTSLTIFGSRITDLGDCLLAGLGSVCPKLTHLALDNQEEHFAITTAGLDALFASCTGLQSLSINILDEFLYDSFFSVSSLEVVELVDCKNLRNFPTYVFGLVRLERVLIQNCPKITSLPRSFGHLPSLRYLAIEECENIGRLPQSIGHLSSLERLDLCQLEAFSVLPSTIHMLSSLRAIVLRDCRNIFTRPEFSLHLHRCTGLQSLEFHWPANCSCEEDRPGVTTMDEGLMYSLCRVSSLSTLLLFGFPTLSTIPEQLENLSQLERLELHSWPSLRSLPDSITKLSKLRTLVISGCPNFKDCAAVIRALPNVSVNVLEGSN
ncbi:unnamed protein product [Closterium sp. Yama58-4]|nr:unnamed protein product [Closterium sp. Yama58-4]